MYPYSHTKAMELIETLNIPSKKISELIGKSIFLVNKKRSEKQNNYFFSAVELMKIEVHAKSVIKKINEIC